MSLEKNRRSNYFIKKDFQGKFILRFCALVALGALISGAIIFLYLFFKGTVTTAFVNSRLSIVTTADYILPALISASLITVILISIATALVVKYLSHRIAGPLFKIEKSVKEIGSGDLTLKVHLRSTDEIAKMAECLNEATENIRTRVAALKTQADRLQRQIDNLKIPPADLKEISKTKEVIGRQLDYFKI